MYGDTVILDKLYNQTCISSSESRTALKSKFFLVRQGVVYSERAEPLLWVERVSVVYILFAPEMSACRRRQPPIKARVVHGHSPSFMSVSSKPGIVTQLMVGSGNTFTDVCGGWGCSFRSDGRIGGEGARWVRWEGPVSLLVEGRNGSSRCGFNGFCSTMVRRRSSNSNN